MVAMLGDPVPGAGDGGSRNYPARPAEIYFFGTCLVDLFVPEAGIDAIRLLEREGIAVHFPQNQTCCGQPAYSSGHPEEARAVALQQLGLFPQPWPVVVPSGSCAAMMRHQYPVLFADDPVLHAKALELSARVFELTEFLVHVLKVKLQDKGEPCSVVLHTSCSARREMGVHLTGRALLAQLGNVELREQVRESECCGFGGSFSVRQPEISAAIAGDKAAAVVETGADQLVSADCGCLLNIRHTMEKRGDALPNEHLASFLYRRTSEPSQ